jgi:hypothetical protein
MMTRVSHRHRGIATALLREAERITDVIRHILNLRHLIIVREYDGVQLFLERADFSGERGETFAAHRRAKLEAVAAPPERVGVCGCSA